MCRPFYLSLVSHRFALAALCLSIFALNGCAAIRADSKSTPLPIHLEKGVKRNKFPVVSGDEVVGRLASIRLNQGDALPDIARHFGLGINAITAANPGVDVWVPEAGKPITLPLSFILPDAPHKGIVVNLATMRLFEFKGDSTSPVVATYPVGIGMKERPTPTGQMRVQRKTVRPTWHVPTSIAEDHRKKGDPLPAEIPPGPENPLGEYALYLSKPSYLIHGTNKPASIGLNASNGCLRLYPEDIKTLFEDTPVNTPVVIVNQPYLIGLRGGVLYMEAHAPLEGSGAMELEKIYGKLRDLEKRSGRAVDWNKVKEVQTEARGIPVPISELKDGSSKEAPGIVEVEHPDKLYGRPVVPELAPNAWYVLAADAREQVEAERIAAIINHQGPPIPARVLSRSKSYKVVAGPFDHLKQAKEAVKRLKIDLDLDGILVEPAGET